MTVTIELHVDVYVHAVTVSVTLFVPPFPQVNVDGEAKAKRFRRHPLNHC